MLAPPRALGTVQCPVRGRETTLQRARGCPGYGPSSTAQQLKKSNFEVGMESLGRECGNAKEGLPLREEGQKNTKEGA